MATALEHIVWSHAPHAVSSGVGFLQLGAPPSAGAFASGTVLVSGRPASGSGIVGASFVVASVGNVVGPPSPIGVVPVSGLRTVLLDSRQPAAPTRSARARDAMGDG